MSSDDSTIAYLKSIDSHLHALQTMLSKVVTYMVDAESEIPERVRRFITYMHDLNDVIYMYESRGHPAPDWVRSEAERCDDRYRQILKDLNCDGGAFEKVRREMAKDPENRWDHTRQLMKPKEKS